MITKCFKIYNKVIPGKIVKISSIKTLKIKITRIINNKLYNKYFVKNKYLLVNGNYSFYVINQKVSIINCSKISKNKNYKIINIY